MSLSFGKYVNNSSVRSLDVFITDTCKEGVINAVHAIVGEVDDVDFLLDTLDQDAQGNWCIIGTAEFTYGCMSEVKADIRKAYRGRYK